MRNCASSRTRRREVRASSYAPLEGNDDGGRDEEDGERVECDGGDDGDDGRDRWWPRRRAGKKQVNNKMATRVQGARPKRVNMMQSLRKARGEAVLVGRRLRQQHTLLSPTFAVRRCKLAIHRTLRGVGDRHHPSNKYD